MALCPFARHRLISPGSSDPRIAPVGAVLHVDAGNAASLYEYFRDRSGGIESHFHVQLDGDIEQYRDTAYEADANYRGNSWTSGGRRFGLVSIESQGFEHGAWTAAQLTSIKRLLRWLADEHDFPLQKAPGWQGPGVGYHVMWGAPGPWTPVAKTCPGPDRIRQFNDDIVPWMRDGGQEDELSAEAERKIDAIYEVLANSNRAMVTSVDGHKWSVRHTVKRIWHRLVGLPRRNWRRRLPWWGGWDERWPELAKKYPNGYSAEALQVHTYGHSRAGREELRSLRTEMRELVAAQQPLLEAAAQGRALSEEDVATIASQIEQITAANVAEHLTVDVTVGVDDAPAEGDERADLASDAAADAGENE